MVPCQPDHRWAGSPDPVGGGAQDQKQVGRLPVAAVDGGTEAVNKFGLIVAIIQLFACAEAIFRGNWQQAIIYAGFAVGSAGVAWK